MGIRCRAGAWTSGLVFAAVVALGAWPLAAQESSAAKPAESKKAAPAVKAVDPSRRVPALFGQVGLTTQQKEEIYKIRERKQAKIDTLRKEIAQIQAEMVSECEALLNDSQKQLLNLRREASARAKRAKSAPAESPVASKATGNPAN